MGTSANDPTIPGEAGIEASRGESTGIEESARTGSPGLSRDDVFDVLSNHRRRYALHTLKRRDGTIEIGDLAEQIAAWENEVSVIDLTAAQRKRVYTALQQFHLPKMDTAGIVAFDDRRGVVALAENTAPVDVYLDVVPEDDIPWSSYYLGLSVVGLAAVFGVWLAPFELLPPMAWAAIVAGVFFVSSLVHAYTERGLRLDADGAPSDHPEE